MIWEKSQISPHPINICDITIIDSCLQSQISQPIYVFRTRLESLCNQLRQSVSQSVSLSQKFSYFPPLDFSDFLHEVSLQ